MKLSKVEIAALSSLLILAGSTALSSCKTKAPEEATPSPSESAAPTGQPAAPSAAAPQEGRTQLSDATIGGTTSKSPRFQVTGGFRRGASQ